MEVLLIVLTVNKNYLIYTDEQEKKINFELFHLVHINWHLNEVTIKSRKQILKRKMKINTEKNIDFCEGFNNIFRVN